MRLSREDFGIAVDKLHAEEKAELLARFDLGTNRYGSEPDLTSRDWRMERREERLDARVYRIFERELERLKDGA